MACPKISLLFLVGYLTLIIATEQISSEDSNQLPYVIYGKRSPAVGRGGEFPYYPDTWDVDGGIRLKKWSTQLRFGKRGSSWASQVRYG